MKKLMIAAAVAMIGVAANAALATWGMKSTEIAGPVGGDNTDGYGYLADGQIFLFVGDIVSASDSAFNFGEADYITDGGITGDFNWGNPNSNVELEKLGSTAADQAFALILIDQTGLTYTDLASYEGNYVLFTGTSKQGEIPDPEGGATTYYAKFLDGGSTYAGEWKTMAAPEPTSGLLLLLGVAGLALRRRRV